MEKRISMPLCKRLTNLLQSDQTMVNLVLFLMGILLALGFVIGTLTNENYAAIDMLASKYLWALGFFIYGSLKLTQCIRRVPCIIKAATSIVGMWGWNYMILSFILIDNYPMSAAELLFFVPLICELWYLSSLIYVTRQSIKRGRDDA